MRAKWPVYTRIGASVFNRGQKFCESAARLDGLASLRFGDRMTEPETMRCGLTRVRVLMYLCISHVQPPSRIINFTFQSCLMIDLGREIDGNNEICLGFLFLPFLIVLISQLEMQDV